MITNLSFIRCDYLPRKHQHFINIYALHDAVRVILSGTSHQEDRHCHYRGANYSHSKWKRRWIQEEP